jgi:hypothetical protein
MTIRHITHTVFFLTLNLIVGCKAADDKRDADTDAYAEAEAEAEPDAIEDSGLCAELGELFAEVEGCEEEGASYQRGECDEGRMFAAELDCLNELDTFLECFLESPEALDLYCEGDDRDYTGEGCRDDLHARHECFFGVEIPR